MDFKLVLKMIKVVHIRENQLGMNHIFLIFHMFLVFIFKSISSKVEKRNYSNKLEHDFKSFFMGRK